MRTIEFRIKQLLTERPELRTDDKELMREYWRLYDGVIMPENFHEATNSETIQRSRRKVQEENPHLKDLKTQVAREQKQREMYEYYKSR